MRKYTPRLSINQKVQLIEQVKSGNSVTKVTKESGISRTIFYRWLKEYSQGQNFSVKNLKNKNPKGRKHWRKIKKTEESKIIKLALKKPDLTVRKISEVSNTSVGAVWNILSLHRLNSKADRLSYIREFGVHIYKFEPLEIKEKLLKRYEKGEKIAKIAREEGISRTIFYKWIKNYEFSQKNIKALKSKRPAGSSHWRFVPGLKEHIEEIISKNPAYSLSEIAENLKEKGQNVSRSGLYYMLRRMNLPTYETRLNYAMSHTNYNGVYPRIQPQYVTDSALYTLIIMFVLYYLTNLYPLKTALNNRIIENGRVTNEAVNNAVRSIAGKTLERANQDFKFGAVAVNTITDSSEFGKASSSAQVKLGFGVIDHIGQTQCNVNLSYELISQEGDKVFEASSANNNGIQKSKDCSAQSQTNTPDYLSIASGIKQANKYKLSLTATTYEGTQKFDQSLEIENNPNFQMARTSYPTRIFPQGSYPIEITLKPAKDFKGEIVENLPQGIKASKISSGGVLYKKVNNSSHIIKWSVELKKGKVYKLSYILHFPQVYPAFYEIGPLTLTDKATDSLLFQENRYWQVVADP